MLQKLLPRKKAFVWFAVSAGLGRGRFRSELRPEQETSQDSGVRRHRPIWSLLGLILLHFVLALLMSRSHPVAGGHAFVTLLFGVSIAFRHQQGVAILNWIAYTVGAEVLWRMCGAPIPWEFAKHAIWVICLISLLRTPPHRLALGPVAYMALLVPAGILTLIALPFHFARQDLSFYLAAPLCLAACALRILSIRLTSDDWQNLGFAFLFPILSIAFLVLFRLATTEIEFGSVSNAGASGGYGPNQVSAMLGFGALLCVLLCFSERTPVSRRVTLWLMALWLLSQASLTFSRTGLYLFAAAFATSLLFLLSAKQAKSRAVVLLAIIGTSVCALLPALNDYTGGVLADRFANKSLTGRDEIAREDIAIWLSNPVLGAGVGMSARLRGVSGGFAAASHTEFTRVLADHGLLGLASLGILLFFAVRPFCRPHDAWTKGILTAFSVWSMLFLASTATRLAAPAVLLAIAQAQNVAGASRRSPVRWQLAQSGGNPKMATLAGAA